MRKSAVATAFALAAFACPASAAELSGIYTVQGSCPAPNSAYRGSLSIQSQGLFHTLTWQVGTETIVGRGMEHDGHMAIEFRFANGQTGLMDVTRTGRIWRGHWAVYGSDLLCIETWTPR